MPNQILALALAVGSRSRLVGRRLVPDGLNSESDLNSERVITRRALELLA